MIIDAASFTTKNRKRDDHLHSDAILAVVKYPTIVFTANDVRPSGTGGVEVTGTLTVHGRSPNLARRSERNRSLGDGVNRGRDRPKFVGRDVARGGEDGSRAQKFGGDPRPL